MSDTALYILACVVAVIGMACYYVGYQLGDAAGYRRAFKVMAGERERIRFIRGAVLKVAQDRKAAR